MKLEREKLLALWSDMWDEGNWIPSWPDSLKGLTAAEAAWSPAPDNDAVHSIWQEVVHVAFWRRVTLPDGLGGITPGEEEREVLEFAAPGMGSAEATEDAWAEAVSALKETHDTIAAALRDKNSAIDVERVLHHIIHDPYHLGRITLLRAMQGTPPSF